MIRFQIPANDCCADCAFSKSLRSVSVLRRMPDQNRSDIVFSPSTTPLSVNRVAGFHAAGTRLIPYSSHHFTSVSRRADRDIFTLGSNAHSVARNDLIVSLTVRRFVVACETFLAAPAGSRLCNDDKCRSRQKSAQLKSELITVSYRFQDLLSDPYHRTINDVTLQRVDTYSPFHIPAAERSTPYNSPGFNAHTKILQSG